MLILTAAAMLGAAAAQPVRTIPPAPASRNGAPCPALSRHATGDRRGVGVWRDFRGGPPVDAHLAVDRRVDGCPVPVLAGRLRP